MSQNQQNPPEVLNGNLVDNSVTIARYHDSNSRHINPPLRGGGFLIFDGLYP